MNDIYDYMAEKLKPLETIVLRVLKRNEQSRVNDFILYGGVLKELNVSLNTNLFQFLANAKEDKMPPFESVTRCRRHIQELMPELKKCKTAVARQELTEEYKLYNLSDIGDE